MAVRRTGISDEFTILNSSGTDITDKLGPLNTISWTINKNTEKQASVGQQPDFVEIVDGVVDIQIDITVDAPTLEVINVLTDGLADQLPEFTVKIPITTKSGEEETLEISGAKFEASLEITDEEIVSADFSGIARECETTTEALSTSEPDNRKPLTFMDVNFEIESEEIEAGDSFSIDFNRQLQGERGIKPVSSESQRPFYDEIIEGMKDYSGTLDFQITDDMATKHFFDDATDAKQFSGSQRTLINEIKVIDDKNSLELVLSDCQFEEISSSQEQDTEVRVISSAFDALDATIQSTV